MDKLIAALKRLYFLDGQHWYPTKPGEDDKPVCTSAGASVPDIVADCLAGGQSVALELVTPEGLVRTLVVSFENAVDWEHVAKLYQAVQDELDLPAPAISISGHGGYALWFSLTEAILAPHAAAFLEALRCKYLAGMPPSSISVHPDAKEAKPLPLVPAQDEMTGKWSAFIDPSMGSMFVDEPGLEMAPNMGRQADMLDRLKSIKPAELTRAMEMMQAAGNPDSTEPEAPPSTLRNEDDKQLTRLRPPGEPLNSGKYYTAPRSFLLAVMNDPSASIKQRIKAAKALLLYVQDKKPAQNNE